MNKTIVLLIAFILLTTLSIANGEPTYSVTTQENTWTTKTSMPVAISGAKAAVVDGKIYVIAGDFNYEYDPVSDAWTAKEPMPSQRSGGFAIAACQGKIYVIGGYNQSDGYTTYLSTNEVYDPSTNTWETKEPMPTGRSGIDANVVDNKIYVIGGITDNYRSIHTPVNEVYDPSTDSWSTKQSEPIANDVYTSAVVGNMIYILGGRSGIGQPSSTNSNQIYDAEKDIWAFGTPLPIPAYYAAAATTSGEMAPKRIYVIGGGFESTSNAVQIYNPTLDEWDAGAPMPTNRTALAVAVVNDIIYAMGGNLGWTGGDWPFSGHPVGVTNAVEQYTPFDYKTPDFPALPLLVATPIAVTVASVALLVYFKKRKR